MQTKLPIILVYSVTNSQVGQCYYVIQIGNRLQSDWKNHLSNFVVNKNFVQKSPLIILNGYTSAEMGRFS